MNVTVIGGAGSSNPAQGVIYDFSGSSFHYNSDYSTGGFTINVVSAQTPVLTINKTHSGEFTQGQIGATYTIAVGNSGTAATSGMITVTDTLPTGLTATAMSGSGWTCTLATLTCTSSATIAAGGGGAPITLTVNVATNAPASVTNTTTASGGGASNTPSHGDPTTITPISPTLTINKTHTGNFSQGQTGAAYTITVGNSGSVSTSGTIAVTDTLPAGLTATAMSGSGWTCTLATLTCTSSAAIAAGGSGAPITLTVNVASNAPASVINTATASGGGASNTPSHDDPTTITTVSPMLTIAKTHTGNFTQGQIGATYSISVGNSGGAATSGTITVTDTLPTGLTFVSGVGTGWTCSASGQVVTCASNGAPIPAGSSGAPIALTVNVAANAPGSVINTATASGGGAANTPSASDPTTITAIGVPALTLSKSHTGNFAQGQTAAAYTIAVGNSGTVATTGTITVTDTLPTGLTYVSASGAGWSCSASGQAVTCTSSTVIAASSTGSPITLMVNVAANAQASVTNTATASGGGATSPATADDPTTITPVSPLLTIDKTHAGNFAQGQTGAAYTITVGNSGAMATSGTITVTDMLPTGLTYVSGSGTGWSCSAFGPVVTCTTSTVIAGGGRGNPITLTVNVAPNAPASVINTATASGGGATNTPSHSDPTNITPLSPVLTISKTHAGNFTQGQIGAAYTITVGNSGAVATSGTITVNDVLPTGLTYVAGLGTDWACSASGQAVTCTSSAVIAATSLGNPIILTLNVAANAPASVTNIATASGGGATNTTSHSDPTTITTVSPTLTIAKTHTGNFTQGQTGATYTITVGNSGATATLGTITVTDVLPTGLTYVAGLGADWSCSALGQAVTCTSGTVIAAGASGTPITLTVNVATNAPASVINTATATGGGATNTPSASDPTTIAGGGAPALTISKTHVGNFAQGQAGAAYTIAVGNSGGSATNGTITVTDLLPTALTFVSGTGTGWTCSAYGPAVTCTSSAAIAAGSAGAPITLTVNVAADAAPSVINTVTASGGGAMNTPSHSDPATITASGVPELTISKTHAGNFTQGQAGAAYTITVGNSGTVATAGMVTVTDLLPTALTFASGTGAGWSCGASGPVVTCTSNAAIAAGATGAPITLTVNVAADAPPSVTNTATAAGGGATNMPSHSDPTTISRNPLGSISGFVWYDLNHNGIRDPGEPPKVDWLVELLLNGEVVMTVLTNSSGNYTFSGVLPGKYTVRFTQTGTVVPGGGAVNGDPGGNGGTPSGGQLVNINVVAGFSVTAQSLPIDPSGVVYESSARTAIAGARVTIGGPAGFNPLLHLAGGLATQVTATGGQYAFFLLPGAPSGTYTLTAAATGYKSPSTVIPPQSGGWPVTGGSIGVYGVPTGSQPTTYFLSGPLPIGDVVNNNLPLDLNVQITMVPVPTLSEWAMIVLSTLLLLAAVFEMRHRVHFRSRR